MAKGKRLTKENQEEILEYLNKDTNSKLIDTLNLSLKCKTEGQKSLVNSIVNNEITICSGLAGTGKTYITCFKALKLLKSSPEKYKKIVLVKSVTTLKDEEIGFLKGTLEEKMEPFIYSFIHNFEKIIGKKLTQDLRANNMIEIMPIAYMRGINLDNSIIIIDESQNLTKDHILTILTRLGKDSKMIFLGDKDQIDRKNKTESGLEWMINKFKNFDEIGTIILNIDDVVRNSLVSKILDFLAKDENK